MLSKTIKFTLCAMLIFGLIVLSACKAKTSPSVSPSPALTATPMPEPLCPGLTVGIPCSPPCWLDIQPGITTLQQAHDILRRYADEDIVLSRSIITPIECFNTDLTVLDVKTQSRFADAIIVFKKDLVYSITIQPPDTMPLYDSERASYAYTFGELVERYGDPERVSLFGAGCSECSKISHWDAGLSFSSSVYYPNQGMMFVLNAPDRMLGCLCPNMIVVGGRYFTPISFSQLEPSLLPCDFEPGDYSACERELMIYCEEETTEWHGFGGGY